MEPSATYFRARFVTFDGQVEATWSLYYAEATTTGFDYDDVSDFATLIAEEFTSAYTAVLPASVYWTRLTLSLISPSIRIDADATGLDFPYVGEADEQQLPCDSAVCIQRRSIYTGREKHGRVFVPNVAEVHQSGGMLSLLGSDYYDDLAECFLLSHNVGAKFLHPAHIDRKHGSIIGVSSVRVNQLVMSRMDRRQDVRPLTTPGVVTSPLD